MPPAPTPSVHAAAPGRVNLIGEHTDYNGGFVLPTAIPQRTTVELSRRGDHTVVVRSAYEPLPGSFSLGQETHRGDWLDYIQGITWALRQPARAQPAYAPSAGASATLPSTEVALTGFELSISSSVPLGAGLSSSASLEVAVLRAIREAFGLDHLDDVRLAQLGQLAENDFVGAHCGIMDQMSASLADDTTALFLDTRTLEFRRIPLPSNADLIVVHSGVSHDLAAGDYNTRRAECEEAARQLGVPQLRDLSVADLARLERLPDPLSRRARHVLTEDERVLAAVRALEAADIAQLGELFYASHASMRDDFEVSVPAVDLLVEIAGTDADIYGARMTGGGFGGSVVMLAHRGRGRAAAERIAGTYAERSGRSPTVLVPPPLG
jgi:galactokinase